MKILCSFLLFFCATLHAEITLDGTLGRSGFLPGPDYRVTADFGLQHGGNLFHSFGEFSISSHESATFSGPDSVQNIISRVTGGNSSVIDGVLRSAIADADMYLLNPNGVMFGPNARLDVQGGFHAATADYLRLSDDARFYADPAALPNLSVAPPAAFGFLTDSPAPITMQNSDLAVPAGKTLSLVGGDLHLSGESPVLFDEMGLVAIHARSKLSAEAGRINLAGAASKGEVIPHESELESNAEGGEITLDKTMIEASGGGAVFIRGGQLVMRDAAIQTNTASDRDSLGIDMRLSESVNMSGDIQAVLSKTFGGGKGGDLTIVTPDLEITGSAIDISSFAQGNAGAVNIKTIRTELKQGALIASAARGQGKSAHIHLDADESFSLRGQRDANLMVNGFEYINFPSVISTNAYSGPGNKLIVKTNYLNMAGGIVGTTSFGEGASDDITVRANDISISDGGLITSVSLDKGKTGNIGIIAEDTLFISGRRNGSLATPFGVKFEDNQSAITSVGFQDAGGNISISSRTFSIDNEAAVVASTLGIAEISGSIRINTGDLYITQGGHIDNSNGTFLGRKFFAGPGRGGAIQIKAKNIMIAGDGSGIFSNTFTSGQGGNIGIKTDNLAVNDGGTVSARSSSTGNAGQISIRADSFRLSNQGEISTKAGNAAGGNISVNAPGLLYLHTGKITATVGAGKGRGGDIDIENQDFTVLNKGQIKARADEGRGGDIRIISGNFLKTGDSIVSASSRLGIDGNVDIASPDADMAGGLMVLQPDFLDVSQWLHTPCAAARRSSFVKADIKGVSTPAGDLLPGGPLLPQTFFPLQEGRAYNLPLVISSPSAPIKTSCSEEKSAK